MEAGALRLEMIRACGVSHASIMQGLILCHEKVLHAESWLHVSSGHGAV